MDLDFIVIEELSMRLDGNNILGHTFDKVGYADHGQYLPIKSVDIFSAVGTLENM